MIYGFQTEALSRRKKKAKSKKKKKTKPEVAELKMLSIFTTVEQF